MSSLVACFLVIALLFVPALADIGAVNRARAQAQNAADAAALAAAQEMVRGGDPAAAARSYVDNNGGKLCSVVTEDRAVIVSVEEPCSTILAKRLGIGVGPVCGRGKAELKETDEPEY